MAKEKLTQRQKFFQIMAKLSGTEIKNLLDKMTAEWLSKNHKKYGERVVKIIKEYAAKVDIAEKFRKQWNASHAPWDRYAERTDNVFGGGNFVNNVKYEVKGNVFRFYNDTQPDAPFWGTYEKKSDDDLSNWIEGDLTTGNSYIHPIPPYYAVNKKGRADYIIFKGWFDKSEWKNMWYKGDPYMHKALEDSRVRKIFRDMNYDFCKYFEKQIVKQYWNKSR